MVCSPVSSQVSSPAELAHGPVAPGHDRWMHRGDEVQQRVRSCVGERRWPWRPAVQAHAARGEAAGGGAHTTWARRGGGDKVRREKRKG